MLDITAFPQGPFMQNTRFLTDQDTGDTVVVDPADMHMTESFLNQSGLKPTACLITHGHLDHVSAVAEFMKKYPEVKVYGPQRGDAPLIASLSEQARLFGISAADSFEPEYVSDGQELKLFKDASFKVIHTPGHTMGSVCYYCAQENFVLVGDTLFQGSVGRTDLMGGNFDLLVESLKKLMELPDHTDVMCGHGEDTTIEAERLGNPYIPRS